MALGCGEAWVVMKLACLIMCRMHGHLYLLQSGQQSLMLTMGMAHTCSCRKANSTAIMSRDCILTLCSVLPCAALCTAAGKKFGGGE
jgi:hypothetical protein